VKATEVTAGPAESNGSLLLGLRRDSLHVTCGLNACTLGSVRGPTLGNEYGKTLPLNFFHSCYALTFLMFFNYLNVFITARCYASAVLAMAQCPSVRPFVRLSVTSRSSTKTAKRRITQTTPHDSPGTLVFGCQRSPRNSTGITPCGGAKCRWGGSKSATFDKYLAISRKRYKIDAWFLLKSNRKSYVLYRMVTLPMTLSDR